MRRRRRSELFVSSFLPKPKTKKILNRRFIRFKIFPRKTYVVLAINFKSRCVVGGTQHTSDKVGNNKFVLQNFQFTISMMSHRLYIIVLLALTIQSGLAWSPQTKINVPSSQNEISSYSPSLFESRRNIFQSAALQICILGAAAPVIAAEPTIYRSGKTPIVPGQKPKDKNDLKGTRKDPDFLRSVADCKNQCQSSNGPDGLAKSKEDCLSECQDICCTTYEQCTFNIVPRL